MHLLVEDACCACAWPVRGANHQKVNWMCALVLYNFARGWCGAFLDQPLDLQNQHSQNSTQWQLWMIAFELFLSQYFGNAFVLLFERRKLGDHLKTSAQGCVDLAFHFVRVLGEGGTTGGRTGDISKLIKNVHAFPNRSPLTMIAYTTPGAGDAPLFWQKWLACTKLLWNFSFFLCKLCP